MHPIAEILKDHDITQKELAKLMKIPEPTLSYRLNNYSIGTLEYAIEVAKTIGVKRSTFEYNGCVVSIEVNKRY